MVTGVPNAAAMNPPIISSLFCIRTRREKDSSRGNDLVARMDEEVGSYKGEEDNGNHAIHGEEGGVEFAQVAGRDQRVLVEEQEGNSGNAGKSNLAQAKRRNQHHQQSEH